jgi:hypothetical protein
MSADPERRSALERRGIGIGMVALAVRVSLDGRRHGSRSLMEEYRCTPL